MRFSHIQRVERICKMCEKPFITKNFSQKYCGGKKEGCSRKNSIRLSYKIVPKKEVACVICKVLLVTNRNKKTCSYLCYRKHINIKKKKPQSIFKSCNICNLLFQAKGSSKYCTKKCSREAENYKRRKINNTPWLKGLKMII